MYDVDETRSNHFLDMVRIAQATADEAVIVGIGTPCISALPTSWDLATQTCFNVLTGIEFNADAGLHTCVGH